VRLIPVNDLVRPTGPASGYTVIGGGKTAMDACSWLLDSGVPPEVIRWIRPRDAWLLDRAYQQPLDLATWLIEGMSLCLEAAAQAEDVSDLFGRLEACGSSSGSTRRSSPRCIGAPPSARPSSAACGGSRTSSASAGWCTLRLTGSCWRTVRSRPVTCTAQRALSTWLGDADLSAWMERARLNAARGIGDHLTDPRMKAALTRMFANAGPAVTKLQALQAQAG
jgi:hypothetical protein